MRELTKQEACTAPASFMYIFATDEFLSYIEPKYANIIKGKRANQVKILMLSADKYLKDEKRWTEYGEAIRSAFIEMYGMQPIEALSILAQGGSVAGKNWKEGIYGIGATANIDFGKTVNGHSVFCNSKDGHIYVGTVNNEGNPSGATDITDESKTVYKTIKRQAIPYQLFSREMEGMTFMTQYNKTRKQYDAQSYSTSDGEFSARTGAALTGINGGDIWGTIIMYLEKFVEWLISIFVKSEDQKEPITAANTLPSQTGDGFVQTAGMSTGAKIALALAAGGAILYGTTPSGKKTMKKMFATKKSRRR